MRDMKRTGLAALVAFVSAFGAFGATKQAQADAKGVIELYTSQGCSACPPADELAGEYAENSDLVVLTLPVTYWDYLGWKDTFAKKSFTKRQYAYAEKRGDRSVYTPQVVVNGMDHAVGSRKSAIDKMLANQPLPVPVKIETQDGGINVRIDAFDVDKETDITVWLVLFQHKGTVAIGRGENRDREITYTNIVRDMRPLGMLTGEPFSVRLPIEDVMDDQQDGFAVLVQSRENKLPARILGAKAMMVDRSS